MKNFLRQHGPATLITVTFFVLGVIYSIVNPLFEALDEVWHYPFAWHLAQTWELPVQDPANVQLWRQEASQPPLYYALAALLTAPIPTGDLPSLIYPNPHADLGVVTADGNINMIIHTSREDWPWQGAVLAVHLSRLLSVVISTGTVLTVYAIGRTLWPERLVFALLAMSFVAFNPMFLFVSASVNNDNLVTLLASLIIWQLVVLVVRYECPPRRPNTHSHTERGNELSELDNSSPRSAWGRVLDAKGEPALWRFIVLGALIGLASLAKFSGLGLLGLTGLTLLWWGRQWRSRRTMILGNVIVVIVALTIAGWWYWRNFTLYGDWTGTQNMVEMMGPRAIIPTLDQMLAEVPGMMRSFWGLFGGLSVAMPSATYWLLNLLFIVGLAGLPIALLTSRTEKMPPRMRKVWPILVGWIIIMLIGLVQWTLRTPATQGRLLFPALAALAPLWAAGWMALFPSRLHLLPAFGLFVLAIWIPWGIIAPAYARPEPIGVLPSSVQALDVTFGYAIKLLAYESQTPTEISPGEVIPLTLYWRGDKPVKIDYSVFIHLIDESNLIVAQRDVVHGLGLHPSSQWVTGEQFADKYTLRVPGAAYAPSRMHFGVGLYDSVTGARLPVSSGGDMIHFGQIAIQPLPGNVPNPQELEFEDGISLIGYKVDNRQATRAETIKLTLYWQSQATPTNNYKIFVHLVTDGDVRAAQHDSEPQSGAAPTSTWVAGQTIVDEHPLTINPDTPPGAYRIKVGLYNGETGRRLRLLRESGVSVQADSVTFSGIKVSTP